MGDQDEIERIKRIRARQLASRDPGKAERQREQLVSGRYHKENLTLVGMIRDIPAKWWGMIIGGLVGFFAALVLDRILHVQIFADATWSSFLWYILLLFGIAAGRAISMAMDWRADDQRELIDRGRR